MTASRVRIAAHILFVLALGVLAGFFAAFNVVFSDVGGTGERLGSLAYVFGVYLVLGVIVALFRVSVRRVDLPVLLVPALLLLGAYTLREPGAAALHFLVLVAAAAGSWVGHAGLSALRPRGVVAP